ncbi:Flagellar basal-body rod protein FlgG [Gemmata sp. SH-PL17]|nr:Flagellar basal-body rod protein FlgG [Gemmata sp. SH-PL17]
MGLVTFALLAFTQEAHARPFLPILQKEKLVATDRMLDIAIEGDGYFQATNSCGDCLYTRVGRLHRNVQGSLETSEGYLLSPQITVPESATTVVVASDGLVHAIVPNHKPQPLGQILLYRFAHPQHLLPFERGYEVGTNESGPPKVSKPGKNGAGKFRQRAINVPPIATFTRVPRGNVTRTNGMFDLAIEGAGFFRVVTPTRERLFTRYGRFHLDDEGRIVTAEGYVLEPRLFLPGNAIALSVGLDGHASTQLGTDHNVAVSIGQLNLYQFPKLGELVKVKGPYYKECRQSGEAVESAPGVKHVGIVRQGYLDRTSYIPLQPEGQFVPTARCFDLAIEGQGFFEVQTPAGERRFTRRGRFHVNTDGKLETQDGYLLQPPVTLRLDTVAVSIEPDGTVRTQVKSQKEPVRAGQIALARFADPSGLGQVNEYYFEPSKFSGPAKRLVLGTNGTDKVWQGFLERPLQGAGGRN